jgi:hypothetical protein
MLRVVFKSGKKVIRALNVSKKRSIHKLEDIGICSSISLFLFSCCMYGKQLLCILSMPYILLAYNHLLLRRFKNRITAARSMKHIQMLSNEMLHATFLARCYDAWIISSSLLLCSKKPYVTNYNSLSPQGTVIISL